MFKSFFPIDWLLAGLILVMFFISVSHFGFDRQPGGLTVADETSTMLDDSLPHYQYKRLADSIERQNAIRKADANKLGNSWVVFSVGYSVIKPRPSNVEEHNADSSPQHFLRLAGWRMKPNCFFIIENNKWIIERSVLEKEGEQYYYKGRLEKKPVNIRFAFGVDDDEPGNVLIPLSGLGFVIWKTLLFLFLGATVLFFAHALIGTPAAVITRIGRGKTFSAENYRGLMLTGWALIAGAFLPLMLGLIMKTIFSHRIPGEVYYSWREILLQSKGWILPGLIVLLLARAFRRGHEMESENALTV